LEDLSSDLLLPTKISAKGKVTLVIDLTKERLTKHPDVC